MNHPFKKMLSPFRKLIYKYTGKKPWSYGYNDERWSIIGKSIRDKTLLEQFSNKIIPPYYGVGFDERIIEYPWIFSKLGISQDKHVLDAGSTFNFPEIALHPVFEKNNLSIFTFYPEPVNFIHKRISYIFGDLREMPFKENQFHQVICQSTIEHVDMDNSIYGYDIKKNENQNRKSYEYLKVIDELIRVLGRNGKLLLTFPYGKFENHGFFQQFDEEMVSKILEKLTPAGKSSIDYIQYSANGWNFSDADSCKNSESFNPHTGQGKGTDNAAHCRAVCCIEFIKK